MSPVFDVSGPSEREQALAAANTAVGQGALVVLPTDTVYGVGADPFNPDGVAALLAAKGRGRDKPPAVLVPNAQTVEGLAMSVPSYARRLMERFWPGGLTLIFRAQPSLMWDLGDTNGTVGLRMPDDEVALALLEATGPLAVSSANRTGERTATTITEAGFAFGPAVEVYLDGGPRTSDLASTIIDCTKADPMLLRRGTISPEELHEVLGPIDLLDSTGAPLARAASSDAASSDDADATVFLDKGLIEAARPEPAADTASRLPDEAETRAMPVRLPAGEGLRASETEDRGDEPTLTFPVGGVGAEPPFERSIELPGRSGRRSN